ncbi:hypothetical protein ACWCRI_15265, partial [Streptomyces collinus]
GGGDGGRDEGHEDQDGEQRRADHPQLRAARGADAVDVIGGMRDWAAAGLPVVDARGGNGTVA